MITKIEKNSKIVKIGFKFVEITEKKSESDFFFQVIIKNHKKGNSF
jgi:hypothetical protein